MTDGIFAVDTGFRFTFFNQRACEILGVEREHALGTTIWERFPRIVGTEVEEAFRRAMRTQETETFSHHFRPEDRAFEVRVYPSETGLSVYFRDITERVQRQRDLEEVARLHRVISGVNEALADAASRAEIECVVCDRVVDGDGIDFAWIGRQDNEAFEPVAYAGDLRFGRAIESCGGRCLRELGRRALRTNDVVISRPGEVTANDATLARLSATVAAIPLCDETFRRGVLALHASRRGTSLDADHSDPALRQLRDVVALAITAARCRAALVSDDVVEVEFTVGDTGASIVGATERLDAAVEVTSIAFREDGTFELATEIHGDARGQFCERLEAVPGIHEVRPGDDPEAIQVRLDPNADSVIGILAKHGGHIRDLSFEGCAGTVRARIPERSNVSALFGALETRFDEVELRAKREGDGAPVSVREWANLTELTDRQREVLLLAYRLGYFEWPRDTTAEEMASTLGISAATFHEHLRTAERKLLQSVVPD